MRTFRPAPALTLAALAVGLAWGITGYPLLEPDEGRNAEVAREMAAGGDWILPRLNDLPYLDKPVLFFAVTGLSIRLLGPTELAARLPTLLFTVLTAGLLWWFGRSTFDDATAWTTLVAYAASPFAIAYAHTVIFDSALTFWITAALLAFHRAFEMPTDRRDGPWGWTLAAWSAIGMGVLTKGPVAVAVPLLVVLPYAFWRRAWRPAFDPTGLLAFAAIVLPWVLLVQRRVPDFLQYVATVETAQRITTDALGRTGPIWYFLPVLLGATLPWSVAALAGFTGRAWQGDGGPNRHRVFLALWLVMPLVLFTLSQSKRPQYVLPLVPAVALLVGRSWAGDVARCRSTLAAAGFLLLVGIGLLLGRETIAGLFDTTPQVAAAIPGTALWLGGISLFGAAAAMLLRRRRDWAQLALALPVVAIPVVAMPLMRAVGADRSSKALAEAVTPALRPDTEIVAVGTYPLSLPFYTERVLTLATADGRELTSNYIVRHEALLRRIPGATLRPLDWWFEALTFCNRPRLFVVPRDAAPVRDQLASRLPFVAEDHDVAAYGPCGVADLAARP